MPDRRGFLLSLLSSPFGAAASTGGWQHRGEPPLPPVSWSCPMHAEVVDNKPGPCPICAMALQPVRLALVWTCPVHSEISELQAGRCRRCGRDLIRVTKSLAFTCVVHRKVNALDPGRCPTCQRKLVARYRIRPHGDHNPKHGGQFMMVSNNWHLEVTHPVASVFRLYVYDEYSKPFQPSGLAARIIEIPDRSGRTANVSLPFAQARRGSYLEARVPDLALPAKIAINAQFETTDKPYRFDFIFFEYSKEPAGRSRS
jgi:hypothetical protein